VPVIAALRRGCTPEVAHQALTHPVTGALWIVRGGQVFEVGRRGTQYKLSNGQCQPSYSGRACPVGQWSSPTTSCANCAVNESLYNRSSAWRQQCANDANAASDAQKPRRQTIRLILAASADDLNAGDAASLLRRAVGDGVVTCMSTAVGGVWRVAYECMLTHVKAPSDALRALRAMVIPGVQDFVAPPSVVFLRGAETTQQADEGPSVGVIVGATAAGVLGVVLVVALIFFIHPAAP
jgi:hypothetical protein